MTLPPEDDLIHLPGAEENFNESLYYNFYDPSKGIGGFMRLGNRVNEGHAELTMCLYLPNGHALFDYQRAPIRDNSKWEAGGMAFTVLEPLVRHHTTYSGSPIEMPDPMVLVNPGETFRTHSRVKLEIDLMQEATAEMFEPPPYGLEHAFALEFPSIAGTKRSLADSLAVIQHHNEQHMKIRGHVVIQGETIAIEGLGVRDHSWGPRTWSSGGNSRWLTVALRANLGLMVQDLGRADGTRLLTGVVIRDGKFDWMRNLSLETTWENNFHKRLAVTFETEGGEKGVLEGRVLSMVPLRHKGPAGLTRVGEGLTEYRLGDVVGYGLSEYFDTVPSS